MELSLDVGSASLLVGDRAEFGDDSGAHFSGQSRFVEVRQKKAAEPTWRDFARQIRIVNLASDAVAQVLRGRLILTGISARDCLRRFFTRGTGDR